MQRKFESCVEVLVLVRWINIFVVKLFYILNDNATKWINYSFKNTVPHEGRGIKCRFEEGEKKFYCELQCSQEGLLVSISIFPPFFIESVKGILTTIKHPFFRIYLLISLPSVGRLTGTVT